MTTLAAKLILAMTVWASAHGGVVQTHGPYQANPKQETVTVTFLLPYKGPNLLPGLSEVETYLVWQSPHWNSFTQTSSASSHYSYQWTSSKLIAAGFFRAQS